jgi:hypothetical protein
MDGYWLFVNIGILYIIEYRVDTYLWDIFRVYPPYTPILHTLWHSPPWLVHWCILSTSTTSRSIPNDCTYGCIQLDNYWFVVVDYILHHFETISNSYSCISTDSRISCCNHSCIISAWCKSGVYSAIQCAHHESPACTLSLLEMILIRADSSDG